MHTIKKYYGIPSSSEESGYTLSTIIGNTEPLIGELVVSKDMVFQVQHKVNFLAKGAIIYVCTQIPKEAVIRSLEESFNRMPYDGDPRDR